VIGIAIPIGFSAYLAPM